MNEGVAQPIGLKSAVATAFALFALALATSKLDRLFSGETPEEKPPAITELPVPADNAKPPTMSDVVDGNDVQTPPEE